jgi:hypothetical protein
MITISNEMVLLLSVGMLEIRINEKSKPKRGTSNQKVVEIVSITTKL